MLQQQKAVAFTCSLVVPRKPPHPHKEKKNLKPEKTKLQSKKEIFDLLLWLENYKF